MTTALTAHAILHSESLNTPAIAFVWRMVLQKGEKLTVVPMPTSLRRAKRFRGIREECTVKTPSPLFL